MNTTLSIDAASGAVAANQAPTITSAITKAEQSATEAIFTSLRLAAVFLLQGFAGVLAALYLLGACAFGAALLFYTFSR
jgi:hypothetical protein